MGFIHLIQSLTRHRLVWILLFLLGVVLEGCGLYFQYGLRMDPCVYCVYERAFYMSFIIAGLVGFLYPNFFLFRQLATLTFLTGSAGEWIFVSFATGLVVASLFLLSEFFKRKRNNYTNFYR